MLKRWILLLSFVFLSGPLCAAVPVLTGLAISGPFSVQTGSTASYTANATFSDGSTQTVVAHWLARGDATIDASTGTLTGVSISYCVGAALVAAVYSSGGITKTAITQVYVTPPGEVCTIALVMQGKVLLAGWNLVGHSTSSSPLDPLPLDVASEFGDAEKVDSVWKWVASKSKWAFYTPTQADGGAAYAVSKGYDLLATIEYGEGYWVNAKTAYIAVIGPHVVPPPPGAPSGYQLLLMDGWNLIATANSQTPSQFNRALSATAPPAGEIPINLNTLWAWDAGRSNWYFYAPSLEAQGGAALTDYTAAKNYLDFGASLLEQGMGFWVNKLSTAVVPVSVARSSLQRNTLPEVPDADKTTLAADDTAFALGVYRELLNDPAQNAGNLFFSPHSISVALAMTYAGAKGATAAEMAGALHFTLPQDRLHPAFNWLDLELMSRGQGALGKDGQPFRLHVTNSLWGDAKSELVPAFLDTLAQNYDAGMNLVDFRTAPEPSRVRINDWVADKTEQRIRNLIPQGAVDTLTRLVLVNAVYFNAAWQRKFYARATVSDSFARLDGSSAQVQMMNTEMFFPYAAGTDYQAVELPYDGGELGMVILLPAAGRFDAFEKSLGAEAMKGILGSLKSENVRLGLPKFRIEGGFRLAETMTKLGMKIAFTDMADFSGISTKEPLFVSDIFHKGYVEIDENGTEAAAATGVIEETTSAPPPPKILKVDRPFLFAVVDKKTGAIVFWGRVVDPTR